MIKNNDALSFEEALTLLENSVEALKKEGTTLDEAMQSFESGMNYYKRCFELLDQAKQRVRIYDKDKDELLDL